jgi:hypothetical protein
MASPRADQPAAGAIGLAERLLYAGHLDTVYRDLYMARARELLAPVLSLDEYSALRERETALEHLLRESRLAVERLEWARVQHLSERGQAFSAALAARSAELSTGRRVYGPVEFAFDPFSPGWDVALAQRGESIVATRAALVRALTALAGLDSDWEAFYTGRRDHFAGLQLADANSADDAAAAISPALVAREALEAIQQRDLLRLQRLAERMTETAPTEHQVVRGQGPEEQARRCRVDLAVPFPAAAVQRAHDLGFEVFELPGPRQHLQSLVDFMYRHAREPIFHPGADRHERVMQLYAVVQSTQASALTAQVFREFVELFIHHSYVNSGGARYLPPVVPEVMLVEDFPETAEPPSAGPLLEVLRLPRRQGLARVEIERALLYHGHTVLRERLGLDPVEFQLICLPFDAYLRIGFRIGWGRQQRWTHFDGYQVMDGPHVLALVGGDVRYGGLADLVGISPNDEREGVMTRFAVVRRARLVARWPETAVVQPADSPGEGRVPRLAAVLGMLGLGQHRRVRS